MDIYSKSSDIVEQSKAFRICIFNILTSEKIANNAKIVFGCLNIESTIFQKQLPKSSVVSRGNMTTQEIIFQTMTI